MPQQTIEQLIRWGQQQCRDSASALLDSRVLLSECLQCNATYLMTWPDKTVTESQRQQFEKMIEKRREGHPVAHIIGHRGFWTFDLKVNASTLIPRPETELLVELALTLPVSDFAEVLDLGTGTGAIALALASERENWSVLGCDRMSPAVELANENAQRLSLKNVHFLLSHWFQQLPPQRYDLIVSNPPYVEQQSPYLSRGDVRFEPHSALTAGLDGLDDIRSITARAPEFLVPKGWLLFEHGHQQGKAVQNIMASRGFVEIETTDDLNGLPRVTVGRINH